MGASDTEWTFQLHNYRSKQEEGKGVNFQVAETKWEAENFHKYFHDILERGFETKHHMTFFGEQIKLWVAPYRNEVRMIIRKPKRKSTLFFLLNLVPFNEQNYAKWQGPGTSDQLLFRFSLLLMYYLTKFDETVFKLFQKLHLLIYGSQFMTS